jgi:tetratricopeptide (TPR) repeat protein
VPKTPPAYNILSVYYLQGDDSYYLQTDSGVFGPYVLPPAEMPAETLFGPQAVLRFMGVAQGGGGAAMGAQPQIAALPLPQQPAAQGAMPQQAGQGAARPGAGPFPPAGQVNAAPAQRPNVRPSTAAARDRAWKQIELGDAQFGQRQFARALDHYRDAAVAAADLAEAFFRQAQAEVALGLPEQAVAAIRRGLLFDPDWADSDFRLDQLYGDNKPVKDGRLSDLTKTADAHPHDPAAQLLAGVELYFDDQIERAAHYLRRAAMLYGPQAGVPLQGFLTHLPPAKPVAPAVPNKPLAPSKPAAPGQGLDI